MLRLLLRSIAINLAGIFLAAQILSPVITYVGGYQTLLLAALAIAAVNLFVRPVVNLLLLPIHLVTLGLFRWISNIITLYLVTWLVPNLRIQPFVFPGLNLQYVIIPPLSFSPFAAFLVATLVLTLTFHFLYWLLQD
ncbi:MAG: Membrane protein [Candidatus Amesbacteria bacterium GW2011_GWB1_47_19]|nr:MAG: Membrane protein [Candidatus Amesbacteria bacterium GW2011_GWA1_44_24]KKU31151.1 MAG: Membrane protein [Candidatus Amesbacteria bacterium GW2011_GWC1_46_24]KKU67272.1 MAG: Membrane protein [Candidatus Amesbacteria bacterium GW2011_GWB1_47_19]